MPHASHSSTHDHAHGVHGHDHAHGIAADADRRYLIIALVLLIGFMLAEVVVGLLARSLALITDAGHMLTDVGAIALSLVAMRLAARPPGGSYTFGLRRVEILSAQANGLTLVLLAVWFLVEAALRLLHPPPVQGRLVLWVALAGIAVNLLAVWTLGKANRRSLNVEGSFQHVLTDLYAFIATAIAGAVVWWTGWDRADALAAILVALLMLRSGARLVRESWRVFLEAAPRHLDPAQIADAIRNVPSVLRIDDLHVWEVTSGLPSLSAHLYVHRDVDCHDSRREIEVMLRERFAIYHTTLQTDHVDSDGVTNLPDDDAHLYHCAFDDGRAGHAH